MENVIELANSKNLLKNIDIEKDIELSIERNKSSFLDIAGNVVDKGANYVIKAMPVNDHIKDILLDVKSAFKTKDFKEILKTALNSSIREGLEILGAPKNILKDINNIKNVSIKGGFREGISAAIDIVTKKYLKNNLGLTFITDFLDKTKSFIFSKDFTNKIGSGISKLFEKVQKYKDKCKEWFKSYDSFDIDSMNSISSYLNRNKNKAWLDKECQNQNSTIQNMMELINVKNEKLTPIQMQICSNL